MGTPTLVVVSGPAGSGKTMLARTLAGVIGCPAICRDEIKEGMAQAQAGAYEAAPGDALTQRASSLFFAIVRLLLEAEASVVAEAAFQDQVWRPKLEELSAVARLRIIRCRVDPAVGRQRVSGRPRRLAHADASLAADAGYYDKFVPVAIAAPTVDVDTSKGYVPSLEKILAFINDQ